MAKQILYGVGKSILREFADEMNLLALADLQDVSVETSGDEEQIYGGDNPYPIASFPREKSITISATNTTFDMKMVEITQGSSTTTKEMVFTEIESYTIPSDGIVTLQHIPNADSIIVKDYTSADISPSGSGEYYWNTTDEKLEFSTTDAGKTAEIVYERTVATANVMEVLKDTMSKPFKFIHRIPIYDDNNYIVAEGQLTIYKAKANNSFTFNMQRETAFAPQIELQAQDPRRPDGKLWDFAIEEKTV